MPGEDSPLRIPQPPLMNLSLPITPHLALRGQNHSSARVAVNRFDSPRGQQRTISTIPLTPFLPGLS